MSAGGFEVRALGPIWPRYTLQRPTAGSQMFYDNAGSADKTLKLYEGHAHYLLNDYGKEDVLADTRAWIEARLPAS